MEDKIPKYDGQETEKCMMRKQLAVIVRRVQWSYAIFWSLSITQPGVLEWCYGYYNGDIKTRKTTQHTEAEPDEWGLQRSMQLRELYLSLSAGDSNQGARRPSASLSPEDLTDLEWYYLVCMSFTFSYGQGLPGRTLSIGSEIWLCNAHFADCKVFSRSLLAKSASIQTVVCFPLMNGVLELGTTEQVLENPDLIKQLCSFWELPVSVYSDISTSGSKKIEETCQLPSNIDKNAMRNEGFKNTVSALDPDTWSENPTPLKPVTPYSVVCGVDASEEPTNFNEELRKDTPEYSSNCRHQNLQDDDVYMLQHMNGTFHHVPSLQFSDSEFDDSLHASFKSSDCISQSLAKDQKVKSTTKGERIRSPDLHDIQLSNYSKLTSLEDDSHYRRTLSAILRNLSVQMVKPSSIDFSKNSSFTTWTKSLAAAEVRSSIKQKMLKKVLIRVTRMHTANNLIASVENVKVHRNLKTESDSIDLCNSMADWSRIVELNEKFNVLKSLIPAVDNNKVDKASLLDSTVKYLKDLERRVEELESWIGLGDIETVVGKKKHPDTSERTSDNCGRFGTVIGKRSCLNKRKTCDENEVTKI